MRHQKGAEFTKEMRKSHVILMPEMLGYHNDLLKAAFAGAGYHLEIMSETGHLRDKSLPYISKGCNTGDGWLIAGEVADLISKGYDHILILHPFGYLVSHVCERGILKKLHEMYPEINIQTIEYDYDSSKSLRESRILLGLSDIGQRSEI